MKHLTIFTFLIVFISNQLFGQKQNDLSLNPTSQKPYFSMGWATQATRYSTGNREFDRPFLNGLFTPGNELQVSYHFSEKLSVTTGANYQSIAIHSVRYERGLNLAVNRNNVYIKQISIPLFLAFTTFDNNKNFYQQLVAGGYWGKILNDHYIKEVHVMREGWFENGSYTNYDLKKSFYNLYAGYRVNYRISQKFHLNAEPFFAYQLKNDKIIEHVYNRFLFGFKGGLTYNFRIQ
jgi:hypothetical protein